MIRTLPLTSIFVKDTVSSSSGYRELQKAPLVPDGSQLAEGTHMVPVHDSMPPTSAPEPVRFEAWPQEPHQPCPSHAASGLSESPETSTMPGIFHGPQDESTVAYHNGMGLHMAGAAVPPSFSLPERDDNFTSVAAYSPAGVQDGLAIQDEGMYFNSHPDFSSLDSRSSFYCFLFSLTWTATCQIWPGTLSRCDVFSSISKANTQW